MQKMKKLLIFGIMCLIELAIVSCDKDSTDTGISDDGDITPAGYVDLGLPSGTKWKASNEEGYYDYDSVKETFGSKLPTREQFEELKSLCTFSWDSDRKGANFVSTVNGKSIFLPAAGYRNCDGDWLYVGSIGHYWSSTPVLTGLDEAWSLYFYSGLVNIRTLNRCSELSVCLVHD